jgi:hypothetical protein
MKNIHIKNSFKVWSPRRMKALIEVVCVLNYQTRAAHIMLNRSYGSMVVEWWLHNIGYYLTKPFKGLAGINERCKHVDLEEWTL